MNELSAVNRGSEQMKQFVQHFMQRDTKGKQPSSEPHTHSHLWCWHYKKWSPAATGATVLAMLEALTQLELQKKDAALWILSFWKLWDLSLWPGKIHLLDCSTVSTARWNHQWHFQHIQPSLILITLNKKQGSSVFPVYAHRTVYSGSINRQV